ncbi:hypothetical protein ACFVUN_27825 [Kitasatospora griseola]|uniref:hypothetical protein n=1 Tax=Kitasatospora griseola TaxID=2064 RepID=UPI0036DB30C8
MHEQLDPSADTGLTVFRCAACDAALTGALRQLPAVPPPPFHAWWEAETSGPSPATVPTGCFAVETGPCGPLMSTGAGVMPRERVPDANGQPLIPRGPQGSIVLNPDDAFGLEVRHASAACCGATPNGGMNQLCACGTLVATLCSDCCLPYELHLAADRVRAVRV